TGPLVFRSSPIAPGAIKWIVPLGNLNPPDHTTPTDHIYFYFADPDAGQSPVALRTDFFAPADGTVTDVLANSTTTDRKVRVQVNSTVFFYVDHLTPGVALARGTTISAGTKLGTTGLANAIDLGVIDQSLTLPGLINPARYNGDTLHTDAPLKYFAEPLRSQLYAKVRRIGADLDGKIDYDIPGRLVGNWFGERDQAPLTFAYDTYDPARVRIGIASDLALTGVFAIAATDPLPRDVSVASGLVSYTVARARGGGALGHLLVQMLDDARIRVELVVPAGAPATAFTAAARIFLR
ncbi:MAG: hypothetical protein ACHQO8_10835, partial [Vicinamibacterales bacterium]